MNLTATLLCFQYLLWTAILTDFFYPDSKLVFRWFTAVRSDVGKKFFEVAILKSRKVLDKFGNSVRLMTRQDTSFARPDSFSVLSFNKLNRPLFRCYR